MLSMWAWFVALGPLLLVVAAITPLPSGSRPRSGLACGFANLVLACASAVWLVAHGSVRTPTLGIAGLGFALYLDAISVAMLCLVSFVGLIVLAYSRNYLAGDPGHERFTRSLCLTLACVLVLIISGNLVQLAIAWIGMSYALHRLLVFYPERPAAAFAARKKFIVSRLSDAALLTSLVLIDRAIGSLDYSAIFSGAAALRGSAVPIEIHLAAASLVVAALLKSAQFPLHGWATEVMETPTPVSALLHAGIINAGGFLVLRFSGLVSLSLPSLELLAVVGGFTALFGSVVMLTQTSVKSTLAYSTVAQMGFMMLECGLTAFPAAFLHILAHSLYKAHAFLSSGSVLDIARASWTLRPGDRPRRSRVAIAILAVLAVTFVIGRAFGVSIVERPGTFTLGAVVALALVHLVANAVDRTPNVYVIARTVVSAAAVATAYFALQYAMEHAFGPSLPVGTAFHGPFAAALAIVLVIAFAIVTFLQGLVPGDGTTLRWQRLYAFVANGLYANVIANRLLLRYWPPRVAQHPLEERA